MNHYQKLAFVGFRVIGLAIMVCMTVVGTLHILLYRSTGGENVVNLVSALLYLLLGFLLAVLSKPLSRLAVSGFKDE